MTLTHLSQEYTENARNVREQTENRQSTGEKVRSEKMEFLDSDTDREIETDAEDSKIIQKYTVSRLVKNYLWVKFDHVFADHNLKFQKIIVIFEQT